MSETENSEQDGTEIEQDLNQCERTGCGGSYVAEWSDEDA